MSRSVGIIGLLLGLSGCGIASVEPPSAGDRDAADDPGELETPIDWEHATTCPQPPASADASAEEGKHSDCVLYLGLAPAGLFERTMQSAEAPGAVQRCVGLMSHLPCPEENVAYSDCSTATRADGLTAADRVFFSCAARVCDGMY